MTLAVPRPGAGSPTDQVETTLFRALAVLRLVVLVYAIVLNAVRWDDFSHPAGAAVVVAGMAVWSGFVTWAYDEPRRRRTGLFVADLVVSCLALLSTPLVQSQAMMDRHASTIPSFWVMAAVLAWAVHGGWAGGVGAALVTTICDLSVRTEPNGTTWGNIFLLLLAAGVVGYSTSRLREATEARAAAERITATMQERARLARVVHDGVLQVLALVQRRGLEIGGDAAELGRLAGEQEVALRALVQGNSTALAAGPSPAAGDLDLGERLRRLAGSAVTVSAPGVPVLLPAGVVDELDLVVRACLDNVARHVGPNAPAWVLVEDLGGSVVVTVRDEGPGIPDGRLEEAASEGRLGVRESVCGRMADLGGTATLVSSPGQGTEWELSIPRG
ncbi:MAG: MacS family sensor histidine kinase [Nocardioides sp.]